MPRFQITIANTAETFACAEDSNLLKAMEQLRCKGIPVGCRNGGCGVCKVEVTEGRYAKRKMSCAVVSAEEEARGCVLACKIYPESDLRVNVVGKIVRAVERERTAKASFDFTFSMAVTVFKSDKET